MEFTWATTVRMPLKTSHNGHQVGVSFRCTSGRNRAYMPYFFSGNQWTCRLNWLLYWFHPSPIYRKRKPFGIKSHRYSDWSLLDKVMHAHSVCWQQDCAGGLAEVDAHLISTDSAGKHPVDAALYATQWFFLAFQYQSRNSTAQNLSFTGRFSWANLQWNVIKRIRMCCAFNQMSPISWYLVNPWCYGWRCYYPVSILDSLQELE